MPQLFCLSFLCLVHPGGFVLGHRSAHEELSLAGRDRMYRSAEDNLSSEAFDQGQYIALRQATLHPSRSWCNCDPATPLDVDKGSFGASRAIPPEDCRSRGRLPRIRCRSFNPGGSHTYSTPFKKGFEGRFASPVLQVRLRLIPKAIYIKIRGSFSTGQLPSYRTLLHGVGIVHREMFSRPNLIRRHTFRILRRGICLVRLHHSR